MTTTTGTTYQLEGRLLEVCSCGVLCPCWVGADPDGGECDSFNAYKFDRGVINGVDVSGLSFINVCHIPGNVLTPGSWQVTDASADRLPTWAGLVGEVLAVQRAPIIHETRDGKGTRTHRRGRFCRDGAVPKS